MPTVAPALSLAPPMPAPFEAGAAGGVFAALFHQLAGAVAVVEGSAPPVSTPATGGAALPAATDETDQPATTDATPVPPPLALPAMTVPPSEPATTVADPTAGASRAATAGAPNRSAAVPAAPTVVDSRHHSDAASLAADHADDRVEPTGSGALVGAADSPAPARDPVPHTLPGWPGSAAGEASADSLPSGESAHRIAALSANVMQSAPLDGIAEVAPVAVTAQGVRPTSLLRPSPPATSRTARDPNAAVTTERPPEVAVTTVAAERSPAVAIDAPVDLATLPPAGEGRAEGARGVGTGTGSAPSSRSLADTSALTVAPQLTVAIVRQAAEGLDRVRVQLQPEELGTIEIALELGDDGRARAAFLAERPETVDLLRREAGDLERALRQLGVEVATGGMSFASRDPNGGRDRESAMPAPAQRRDGDDSAGMQRPSPSASRGVTSRLLDLTV